LALGNDKPEFLARTEKLLWSSLLRMAAGSSVIVELQGFLATYKTSSASFLGTQRQPGWFKTGEFYHQR
jgi:hypothetical protein